MWILKAQVLPITPAIRNISRCCARENPAKFMIEMSSFIRNL